MKKTLNKKKNNNSKKDPSSDANKDFSSCISKIDF